MRPYLEIAKKKRVHAALCVLFASFLFFYFSGLQSDVIAFVAYRLHGWENTSPFWTAIALTAILLVLHRIVRLFFYFRDRHYVLSFIPSAVAAVLLTAFVPTTNVFSLVCCALALAAFVAIHVVDKKRRHKDAARVRFRWVPRITWYLMWMAGLNIFVGLASNGDVNFHTELRLARLLNAGDYEAAARMPLALHPTRRQIALKAYALSHTANGVADGLFAQPMPALTHADLFLHTADETYIPFQAQKIFAYLGVKPMRGEADSVFQRRLLTYRPFALMPPSREYYLCGLLLDRDIDAFYQSLAANWLYTDRHDLPQSWCEALILYNRLRKPKTPIYANPNLDQNLSDFLDYQRTLTDPTEQSHALASLYGNTYWWYYFYSQLQRAPQR